MRRLFNLSKYKFSHESKKSSISIGDKLNVKKSLSMIQYSGYMMQVPQQDQVLLSPSETHQDRVVKAYFTQQYELVKVYKHAKEDLSLDSSINCPRNSWYKVVVPLSSNPEMRFKFSRFYTDRVRIGRLLEMMDYVASTVAYKYAAKVDETKITVVTATVDNIQFFNTMRSDRDLSIQGYVTYVGTSSIEVQIDIYQPDSVTGQDKLNVSATFVMVARDSQDHTKAFKVPKLVLEGEDNSETAQLRYEIGKKNQETRKLEMHSSLNKTPPQTSEINDLHEFFTNRVSFLNNPNYVRINDTNLEKNMLMHIQDKNLHGKIFGGFIMREAFELGWLGAYLHVKGVCYPEIFHIDDVQFFAPVDIGTTLSIRSRVTYIQENILHCQVNCAKILPNNEKINTNDLHLTFLLSNTENIRSVYPNTYSEGMFWLNAKRKLMNII